MNGTAEALMQTFVLWLGLGFGIGAGLALTWGCLLLVADVWLRFTSKRAMRELGRTIEELEGGGG